jgi:hypothetical protein
MHPAIENFQKHTNEFLDAVALFADRERSLSINDEWSAAFIIHHVSDGELHFAARYLHTLGTDNPTMIYFDEDKYPDALHYSSRSVAKSLASISGIRAMVLEILTAIPEDSWTRTTTTIDGNVYTLTQLVETADSHLTSHTEQLISLKSQIQLS